MRLADYFRLGGRSSASSAAAELSPSDGSELLDRERSTATVHRVRSLESRFSSLMALGLMCVLGCALLGWYYSTMLHRPKVARARAATAAGSRIESEMLLPPLGPVDPPPELAASAARTQNTTPPPPAVAAAPLMPLAVLPDATQVPSESNSASWLAGRGIGQAADPAIANGAATHRTAYDRQLSGPVFARQSDTAPSSAAAGIEPDGAFTPAVNGNGPDAANVAAAHPSELRADPLERLLEPTVTPAVSARALPTQRLLLAKGAFIDCTLETAIDSTLPGMTTCVTATDTFSTDGKVVLLERGSKLIGETRGEVAQGTSRVFVLWSEARTPTGVVIPLASPGTDELGRAGLSGQVNRHFWQRFGAAVLISIVDAGTQFAMQSGNGTVIYDPTTTANVTGEVLKGTLNIPPTVVKNQGDRIQVFVARDLDFREVYDLRASGPNQ